jgi:aconitate hydratase
MAGMPWELKMPKLIGVKLTGKLNGWVAPKDVILKVAGLLTVKGGTGCIVEYFGEGAKSLSATGKGTICNMGAEIGATTSTFGYDESIERYLRATGREKVADLANLNKDNLTGDSEVYANPEKYFDQVIEIDLDKLEPYINGPFSPDRATSVSDMKKTALDNGFPLDVEWGLIGSCTNSSYEDLSRAASIANQAVEKGIEFKANLGINPGSEQVRYTAERDGLLKTFIDSNAKIFTNACGPCIGQWARPGAEKEEKNSIVHSFNRNFAKRADGNPNTHAFVASPEMVTAIALAGKLDFNPITDTLVNKNGENVKLDPPNGWELPPKGFDVEDNGYQAPAEDSSSVEIKVNPESDRLQILTPFEEWNGNDYTDLALLIKAKGKCTTDHISMAGPWLKYRGHLDNISENMLIGAVNAYTEKTNSVLNTILNKYVKVPESARKYKTEGIGTIVVGDENYGEGSSREHAAMEPRNLGVKVVLVKSFARIHETNLKKQGMLGLTFANKDDYNKIQETDTFDLLGLKEFTPTSKFKLIIKHTDGTKDEIVLNHTYNEAQIEWFKAGSALNLIRKQVQNK